MCVWYFFPRELSFGRGSTAPVGGGSFPTITPREPWDGKDGEVSRSRGFLPSLCISGKEDSDPTVLPGALAACSSPGWLSL